MITKQEPIRSEGEGRPFEMNPRYPIEKNDEERQRPIVVHLGDLNGQEGGKGMPKNFIRKAGRVLPSFDQYWSPEEVKAEIDSAFDVE